MDIIFVIFNTYYCYNLGMHFFMFKMIFVLCLLILLQLMVSFCFCNLLQQQPLCHDHERTFLLQFKESFIIDNSSSSYPSAYPITTYWRPQEKSDCCLWDGVECDEHTGHVVSLDLSSSCLHGLINSSNSLFKLTQLRRLNLKDNHFNYSEIPTNMNNLSRLTYLDLSISHFSGLLPSSLGNLTHLTQLILGDNIFFGPIPPSFSRLKHLEVLLLDHNLLTGTVNFNTFLGLKNLSIFKLSFNKNLSVNIKPSSRNTTLSQFSYLALRSCNLSKFPDFLQYQERLEFLNLKDNKISGEIPNWFWNISIETLKFLSLSYNLLTNLEHHQLVLPWPHLQLLFLGQNKFNGPLPIPQPSIVLYDVQDNSFSGTFPTLFCNMQSLWVLNLKNNSLSGTIPSCLQNISSSLKALSLDFNYFTGKIPQIFTNKCRLLLINFSNNQLQGQIPRSLSNCVMLESLNLGNNKLNDVFPFWLGTLPKLRILLLRSNDFHGVINEPKSNFEFPELRIVDLSCNNFTGMLPFKHIQSWTAMKNNSHSHSTYLMIIWSFKVTKYVDIRFPVQYVYTIIITNKGLETKYDGVQEVLAIIDMSSNKFEGRIPKIIGNLKGLHSLNLSSNMLTGNIPSSLGNLTELESLDLSQNKLAGYIPQQLSQLTYLSSFNVSYNNLIGPIPRGKQFDTFDNNSYMGNSGLYGDPITEWGLNSRTLQVPSLDEEDYDSRSQFKFGWKPVVIGYGTGFVIGLLIGHVLIAKKHRWLSLIFRVKF